MAASKFGTTWWGRAWVNALERGGSGYESRLPRGRTYARRGAVRSIDLQPGFIAARVVGAHGELYSVDIGVRQLASSEWEQVADSIGATAAHLAALLDGELHPGIVDDAHGVDVQLLPGPADLRPDCSCPDWAEPCKHAAAVCYVTATELDRDPFALFLLRGMARDDLIALVRSRRALASGAVDRPAVDAPLEGVDAATAWSGRGLDDPLGALPEILGRRASGALARPGGHSPWTAEVPDAHDIDPREIDALADDAILRAWQVLVDGQSSGLTAGPRADLARRAEMARYAVEGGGPMAMALLADRAGVTSQRLEAWAAAWRLAGDAGVAVLADDDWNTDQTLLAEGRERLMQIGYERRSVALNYDSLRMSTNVWLVIGPDGKWYRLHGSGKHQDLRLAAAPSDNLAELVDPPG